MCLPMLHMLLSPLEINNSISTFCCKVLKCQRTDITQQPIDAAILQLFGSHNLLHSEHFYSSSVLVCGDYTQFELHMIAELPRWIWVSD